MKLFMLGISLLTSWANVAYAQQHVHGQGSVFIVQENSDLLVQFILPASDILGFEHEAKTPLQQILVSELKKTQTHFENLIRFNSKCEQLSYSQAGLALSEHELHGENHVHESPAHIDSNGDESSDDHENSYEPKNSGSSDHHHQDIEVTYQLKCQDEINHASFPLLDQNYDLKKLNVQWSIQSGQGSQLITNKNQPLEF